MCQILKYLSFLFLKKGKKYPSLAKRISFFAFLNFKIIKSYKK